MKLQYEDTSSNGRCSLSFEEPILKGTGIAYGTNIAINTIVWNSAAQQTVTIDDIPYPFPSNTVLPLVANQHFIFERPEALIAWQFNKDFYCIADHDSEVGCVGFLFYGIEHPMFINLSVAEQENLHVIKKLFEEDMLIKDKVQGEMLLCLLKVLIIKMTRIAKRQTNHYHRFPEEKLDQVRMFHVLLETHFRKKHDVRFYAEALNKSPKTLANLFAILHYPAPSKLIQKRITLEAKRYLQYTHLSAKEIAYELGFSSPAHFSRFFKTNTGENVSFFRNGDQ